MERHVVLAHELHELHLARVLPPAFPFVHERGRDADVSDGRVEPHVEDLLLVARHRHGRPPGEVARDAPRLEAVAEPCVGDGHAVTGPPVAAVLDVLSQVARELGEVDEQVLARDDARHGARELAPRVDELRRVEQRAALVALVATGVLVLALGAGAHHVPVREELPELVAVQLLLCLLLQHAPLVEVPEDFLCNLRLRARARAPKVVEIDHEPLVHRPVNLVEVVANLARTDAHLEGLCLRGRAVLVRAADVQNVVAPRTAVPRVHVRAQHAADDVAEVRHVVNIRQRGGDEHVPLRWPRQRRLRRAKLLHLRREGGR